jgi:hypothetical protein
MAQYSEVLIKSVDDYVSGLENRLAALETMVEKLTSYNNARDAIFSEQQVRISQLENLISKVNLSHHVRG